MYPNCARIVFGFLTFAFCVSLTFAEEGKTRGRFPEKMVVRVVDEQGNPIPNANGYHRFGKFVNFNVDENGVFEIPMMSEEKHKEWPTTDFTIRAEGYGPFSAHFDDDPVIPETFDVVLKPAQKIGGIVVDENGQPLEGVKVEMHIRFATGYKVSDYLITSVSARTDAEGKWSLFHLPATFTGSPSLSLEKEGYLSTNIEVPVAKLQPDSDGNFHEKLTIERGYTFCGKVVDENAQPIEGAEVQMVTYNNPDPVSTDAQGNFRFENQQLTDNILISTWASNKASQVFATEIRSDSESSPLKITMQPGRKITFEVKDSSGKPISEATVQIESIAGLPAGHSFRTIRVIKETKTDENGKLTWNEAPKSSFGVSCAKKDYAEFSSTVKADQDTVSATLYLSKIVLRIVDDATGEPIPTFSLVTRMYEKPENERFRSWTYPEVGTGGVQEVHLRGGDSLACRFDIESEGYEPQNSRKVVYGEENVELEIRLHKAAKQSAPETIAQKEEEPTTPEIDLPKISGHVLTPNGEIAKNASIEVGAEDYETTSDTKAVFSDDQGSFTLSDEQLDAVGDQKFVLKITHVSGVNVVDGAVFRESSQEIRLLPWGRLEGTLQSGTKKLEGTGVSARWKKPKNLSAAVAFYNSAQTKKDGHFVFEQLMPGTVRLSRSVPTPSGAWTSYVADIEIKPGETTQYSTSGGSAIGKAALPTGNSEEALWGEFTARVVVKPENLDDLASPTLPKEYWPDYTQKDPKLRNAKRLAWEETEEGKKYKEQMARHNKAVNNIRFAPLCNDGTFRVDYLPAGEYALVISHDGNCGVDFTQTEWHLRTTFTVAEHQDPLDLGVLTLEK